MRELKTDYTIRQAPIEMQSALAPLPSRTLARRRRLMRWGGLAAVLLSLGLSAIPGPKGSSHTVETRTENGVSTQVHQFFFSRHVGLPFTTGRADYNDDGSIKRVSMYSDGFLGNLVVALAMVIGVSIFIGRRRQDD